MSRDSRNSASNSEPVASPSTSTSHAIAASFEVPLFRVGGSFGVQDSDLPTVKKATLIHVHGQFNITPLHAVVASYSIRDVSGSDRDQSSLLVGYNHLLSKRTMLYARALLLKNDGTASVSLGGVTVAPNSGNDASLYGVGVLHRF